MNAGILFATKTKHSQKLAEAIGSALNIQAKDFRTSPVFNGIELLFVVGGIYGGESMPEFKNYLEQMDTNGIKKAALITSCASGAQKQSSVRKILEEKGIAVIDEFLCKGSFLFVSLRHPNEKDMKEAANFALRIMKG